MKIQNLCFLWLFCLSQNVLSQENEFGSHPNGLIYSTQTVKKLKHIVDSLNLKFKACSLHKVYFSNHQGKADHLYMDKGEIKSARKDMIDGMSFGDLVKKYKIREIKKDLFVVKFQYRDYKDRDVIEFSSIAFDDKEIEKVVYKKNLEQVNNPVKSQWIIDYQEKTKDSESYLSAFFILEDFKSIPLAPAYARMVQYSDCLVDTTAEIFSAKAKSTYNHNVDNKGNVHEFMEYVSRLAGKQPLYLQNSEQYQTKYKTWDSLRLVKTEKEFNDISAFRNLFEEAKEEALNNGNSNDEFEFFVERFDSPKTALQLKRNRRVVGFCSQDEGPRIHALNIARLSAEAVNWEIFLRSHLNIMNDRFERVSDGSYAWEARKTYIRELEVLDINVADLLLGISLRLENPSQNHYYGNIWRLGRAIAETQNPESFEQKMLDMIEDDELDNYNRITMYYLFGNYNSSLTDKSRIEANKRRLKESAKSLPDFIAQKFKN